MGHKGAVRCGGGAAGRGGGPPAGRPAAAARVTRYPQGMKKDVGLFFNSVHGTWNHLILGEAVWYRRLTGVPTTGARPPARRPPASLTPCARHQQVLDRRGLPRLRVASGSHPGAAAAPVRAVGGAGGRVGRRGAAQRVHLHRHQGQRAHAHPSRRALPGLQPRWVAGQRRAARLCADPRSRAPPRTGTHHRGQITAAHTTLGATFPGLDLQCRGDPFFKYSPVE